MALQGTIDTFDLTEVVRLLADGEKTGRLGLSGDRGSGSLWFHDGRLVASQTDSSDLASDHAAVLFQLLRFKEGSFVFEQDVEPDDAGGPVDADPVLDEATRRIDEWSEIEAAVPSLGHRVDLSAELSRSDVVIDQARWRAVAAIGGGTSVGDLGHALQQDELDVSRTVKTLVELGLVQVGEPAEDGVGDPPSAEAVEQEDVEQEDVELTVDPVPSGPEPAEDAGSGFDPDWLDEQGAEQAVTDEAPLDATARDQLNALASGFGLTDDPVGGSRPAGDEVGSEAVLDTDDPLELGDPAPLVDGGESGPGSFPIEEAEAAGEATTPLFAHDVPDGERAAADPSDPAPAPGEAAEVARQLANLSPEAARAVAAAARATTDEEREAALALAAEDSDEPLDPDLIRSFLSSVRQ